MNASTCLISAVELDLTSPNVQDLKLYATASLATDNNTIVSFGGYQDWYSGDLCSAGFEIDLDTNEMNSVDCPVSFAEGFVVKTASGTISNHLWETNHMLLLMV